MKKATTKELKFKKIKNELDKLGFTAPGTIRMTYLKCGKPSCACWKDKNSQHGPYHFWDRKVDGKLSSKSINKEMVPILKEWIKNRKIAEELLSKMIVLGQEIALDFFEKDKK